jgi:hypothetical protein
MPPVSAWMDQRMSDHSRWSALILGTVGLVIVVLASQWHRLGAVDLTGEVRQLQQQTLPPRTSTPASADLVRGEFTVRTEWMFTTDLSSRQYFEWLSQHLPRNYAVVGETPKEMVLGRQLAGDACTLTLSATDAEPKRVVAKFSVGPD